MANGEQRPSVQVGDPAPDFTLPLCTGDGTVSLADYRGKRPVLLALERGLYCPFCRRHLVHLGATCEKLRELGIETLVVVAAPTERARLYLRMRPTRVAVAADQERATHRAYGLPNPAVTPELAHMMREVKINPTGELPVPIPVARVNDAYNRLDRFELTDIDRDGLHKHMNQAVVIIGQFLVDADGVVRWRDVECERDGFAGAGKFPTDEELLAAGRAL